MNEINDPQSLAISTRVNGQTLQQANTSDMVFSVAETISYISQLMTLESGDIIATGTPEGVGFKRNPPIFFTTAMSSKWRWRNWNFEESGSKQCDCER